MDYHRASPHHGGLPVSPTALGGSNQQYYDIPSLGATLAAVVQEEKSHAAALIESHASLNEQFAKENELLRIRVAEVEIARDREQQVRHRERQGPASDRDPSGM